MPKLTSTPFLAELIGKIIFKEPKKVYDKKSAYYKKPYFKLRVLTSEAEKHNFFVYPNLVNQTVWKDIENSQYVDKRYLLYAEERRKGFILHNWQELEEEDD